MSRDQILAKIRQNKPAPLPLPEIPDFSRFGPDLVSLFIHAVEKGGGKVLPVSELSPWILAEHPDAKTLAWAAPLQNTLENPAIRMIGPESLKTILSPGDLEQVDLAIIPSGLGVAENGAVWITEEDSIHRVLPFITQHLVVLLPKNAIVQDMHQAYGQLEVDETGFGVFIAGPSKTADIEQALVIGAQGARSFTVFLMD